MDFLSFSDFQILRKIGSLLLMQTHLHIGAVLITGQSQSLISTTHDCKASCPDCQSLESFRREKA
jgi:hypothetical protein